MHAPQGVLRCPRCTSRDIVPSKLHGLWDEIMSGAGRVPRHCRSCGKRFHVKLEAIERDLSIKREESKGRSGNVTETGF